MSKQTKIQPKKVTPAMTASASQTEELAGDQISAETSALIREVTRSFTEIMEQKFSRLSETLETISSTLESNTTRITAAEQRVSDVEDTVAELAGRLTDAEKKIKAMENALDDVENRSRRENIRIINLKEGTEGKNPIQFFEKWLPSLLGLDKSPNAEARIKVDRAHRSLAPRGARPRPVIIKLHNPRDKQRIMSAVKTSPRLQYEGQQLFIHQDLSVAVREKRRGFNDTCRSLIERGIRFNMRYPATLVITHNGIEKKFTSPGDAQSFINALD
ncbi:uncharacterized protein LOC110014714 [Oryzias latipes]|uniref:uncharacterized protein LOC110014714 n=1 Tax=Oryzias latipes TaxID=8090 RepID=UPI000CE26498|nr:uncharacterized protein LOC110014714 [Oryzias latipes]